jgi:Protein of unknown function (DUF2971)
MASVPTPKIDLGSHPVFSDKALADGSYERYIYHYTKWERLLDIMHTGLRLGPLAQMNDPRESKDWYPRLSFRGDPSLTNNEIAAYIAAVAEYKKKIRVAAFCLDRRPSGEGYDRSHRGYSRPRMWAQYAENHKGVCIVIDRTGLDQAIHLRYPDQHGSWVLAGKVEYIESVRSDPMYLGISLRSDHDIEASVRDTFTHSADRLFFVKHADWRDENEYRWVYYDSDGTGTGINGSQGPFVDIRNHVVGLVLGADYADAQLPVARIFAQRHNISRDVVRCEWEGLILAFSQPLADNELQ